MLRYLIILFCLLKFISTEAQQDTSKNIGIDINLGVSIDRYETPIPELGFLLKKDFGSHLSLSTGISLSYGDWLWFRMPLLARLKPKKHGWLMPYMITGAEVTTGGYFNNAVTPNLGIGLEIGTQNPFHIELIHRWESGGIYLTKNLNADLWKKSEKGTDTDFNKRSHFGIRLSPFWVGDRYLFLTPELYYKLRKHQFHLGTWLYSGSRSNFGAVTYYAGYRIYPFANKRKVKLYSIINLGIERDFNEPEPFSNLGLGIDYSVGQKIKVGFMINYGFVLSTYFSTYSGTLQEYRQLRPFINPQFITIEYNFFRP